MSYKGTSAVFFLAILIILECPCLECSWQEHHWLSWSVCQQTQDFPDLGLLLTYADTHSKEFATHQKYNRLMLFVQFSDLDCPLCFDDFLLLVDSIGTLLKGNEQGYVIGLFSDASLNVFKTADRLLQWARTIGISFPVIVVPDTLLAPPSTKGSFAAAIDPSGKVLFFHMLPMGNVNRGNLLRWLRTKPR